MLTENYYQLLFHKVWNKYYHSIAGFYEWEFISNSHYNILLWQLIQYWDILVSYMNSLIYHYAWLWVPYSCITSFDRIDTYYVVSISKSLLNLNIESNSDLNISDFNYSLVEILVCTLPDSTIKQLCEYIICNWIYWWLIQCLNWKPIMFS